MNCKNCRPLLYSHDSLAIGEVELCAVHSLTERLAEALRSMRDQHSMLRGDCLCSLCIVTTVYDRARESQ